MKFGECVWPSNRQECTKCMNVCGREIVVECLHRNVLLLVTQYIGGILRIIKTEWAELSSSCSLSFLQTNQSCKQEVVFASLTKLFSADKQYCPLKPAYANLHHARTPAPLHTTDLCVQCFYFPYVMLCAVYPNVLFWCWCIYIHGCVEVRLACIPVSTHFRF